MNWSIIWLTATSNLLSVEGLPWPVDVRAHPRARSVRLRINERGSCLVLTHPKRMSAKRAIDWARQQSDWAVRQLSKIAPAQPFAPGAIISLLGDAVSLSWREGAARTPFRDGDSLVVGGPIDGFAGRIARYLKAAARNELSRRTAEVAARAKVMVRSVSVGDAVSRWGSCSSSGAIRYNWRLILAPPHILEWVVAHEVAHRRHMNHGPEFRRLEAALFGGDVGEARADLKRLGPGLKRIGLTV
nr:SprT family zinc-dependent metalloprotease [uncultured Sphingomonas sp.]